jgi:hypothetical protein
MRFFESTEELRAKVSMSAGLTFERWASCEEEALSRFLEPIFGQSFLTEIKSWKNSTDGSNLQAHQLVAHSLAKFIMRVYADVGEVMFTDEGITRTETSNTKTAFAQQVASIKLTLEEDGYTALETAINYLYANYSAYQPWIQSPYMAMIKNRVIDSASEMNAVRSMSAPSLIFYFIQPDLERAEMTLLESQFPAAVVAELRTKKTSELAPHYQALKKQVVQFLVTEALVNCIEAQILTLTPKGVKLVTSDYNQTKLTQDPAQESFLNMQLANLKKSVQFFVNQARIYLANHKEDFQIETTVETFNRTRPWM